MGRIIQDGYGAMLPAAYQSKYSLWEFVNHNNHKKEEETSQN
jgi:hypothetical protein